jgi:hypothetical protein
VANVVIELNHEIARVTALLPKLDPVTRDKAERSIRFGELAMKQVAIGDIYESIDELKEFKDPNPAAAK